MKARLLSILSALLMSVGIQANNMVASSLSQGEDLTARVGTSQDDWNAGGVCSTLYAPAITTYDGRQEQMMETYEQTTETTGEMMYQTVTGLVNGDYVVELYANAQYTDGRGFGSDLKDGATDVAYVSANDSRCYITAHIGTTVSENGVYTVNVQVTDGTLRLGLTAEKPGTNWHTIQIKKLTLLSQEEAVLNGTDLTASVGISQDDWHAWKTTETKYAPTVTTEDGRTAQMTEIYEETVENTGELMWQELTGLPDGNYVVEVFANAVYTTDRGFSSSVVEGAEDVAYVEANGQRTYVEVRIGETVPWNGYYRINTTVTDGKLRISMVAEKPGTNWHTIQIKRLVFLANPMPQDKDLTDRVGTSQEAWNAWGVCATQYAPAITTYDGRQAQMMETYEQTTETTGEMMYQTITGLENGDYEVKLYANAQYTDGRGFASDLKDGATDVAYVSANDRRCYVTAYIGTAVSDNGNYTVYAHVIDGTLRIGLTAEKPGTNWHTIQIKKLTLLRQGTVIYADDKEREQGQSNPQWTYTASGTGMTGKPTLTCEATKQSPTGCYVIKVSIGTADSVLPIYLQPGVLTVGVPSGINGVNANNVEGTVYNLQGRRVAYPTKGIYIIDGHKVVK